MHSDSEFDDSSGNSKSDSFGVKAGFRPMTLERCAFKWHDGDAAVWSAGGPIRSVECIFKHNTIDVICDILDDYGEPADVFIDIPSSQLSTDAFSSTNWTSGSVLPLQDAPDVFLEDSDPKFIALRQVLYADSDCLFDNLVCSHIWHNELAECASLCTTPYDTGAHYSQRLQVCVQELHALLGKDRDIGSDSSDNGSILVAVLVPVVVVGVIAALAAALIWRSKHKRLRKNTGLEDRDCAPAEHATTSLGDASIVHPASDVHAHATHAPPPAPAVQKQSNDASSGAAAAAASPISTPAKPSTGSGYSAAGQNTTATQATLGAASMGSGGDVVHSAGGASSSSGTTIPPLPSFSAAPAVRQMITSIGTRTQPRHPLTRRIAPIAPGQQSTMGSSVFTVVQPSTMAEPTLHEQIAMALSNMQEAQPQVLFAGRYQLLDVQFHGGQAVVQLARDLRGSIMQYAIKVFCDRGAFDDEIAQYRDPLLQRVLPQMHFASDNADASARSQRGFVFPPYIVLERGVVLADWMMQPRPVSEAVVMVEALASLLATLHRNGRVHRDIKPHNVLFLITSLRWCLMDMGIVAPLGVFLLHLCLCETTCFCNVHLIFSISELRKRCCVQAIPAGRRARFRGRRRRSCVRQTPAHTSLSTPATMSGRWVCLRMKPSRTRARSCRRAISCGARTGRRRTHGRPLTSSSRSLGSRAACVRPWRSALRAILRPGQRQRRCMVL